MIVSLIVLLIEISFLRHNKCMVNTLLSWLFHEKMSIFWDRGSIYLFISYSLGGHENKFVFWLYKVKFNIFWIDIPFGSMVCAEHQPWHYDAFVCLSVDHCYLVVIGLYGSYLHSLDSCVGLAVRFSFCNVLLIISQVGWIEINSS